MTWTPQSEAWGSGQWTYRLMHEDATVMSNVTLVLPKDAFQTAQAVVLVLYSNCSSCRNQTRRTQLFQQWHRHDYSRIFSSAFFPGRKSKHIILHCTGFTGFHVCGIPMTLLRTVARIQFVGSGRFGEVSWLLIVSALIEAFVLMGALEWAVDSHRP